MCIIPYSIQIQVKMNGNGGMLWLQSTSLPPIHNDWTDHILYDDHYCSPGMGLHPKGNWLQRYVFFSSIWFRSDRIVHKNSCNHSAFTFVTGNSCNVLNAATFIKRNFSAPSWFIPLSSWPSTCSYWNLDAYKTAKTETFIYTVNSHVIVKAIY